MTGESAWNDSRCHAERSEASMSGFLTAFGMTSLVMLSEAKHPRVDSSLTLGMTKGNARNDRGKCVE
jgi:hypothetical protein